MQRLLIGQASGSPLRRPLAFLMATGVAGHLELEQLETSSEGIEPVPRAAVKRSSRKLIELLLK